MHPLQELGLSETAERVYLELVERGETETADLVAARGVDESRLDVALSELGAIGLVERTAGRLIPCPPQVVLEGLAEQRIRQATAARRSAAMLARMWQLGVDRQSPVQLLPSYAAWRGVSNRIQAEAEHEVRALSIGNLGQDETEIVAGLFEALDRGVVFRVVYGTHILRDSAILRMAQACVDAGEDARVFPGVPLNLTIVDDRWALIGARTPTGGANDVAAAVVSRSPFLTGLVGIFDAFWRMAVPITGATETDDLAGAPTQDAKRLLTYLSAGLTDEAIAREFGVSERTVARRITRLQEILGAQTRFQLGVQASRQGWL